LSRPSGRGWMGRQWSRCARRTRQLLRSANSAARRAARRGLNLYPRTRERQ
jgi:hypothetical protein